MVPSDFGFFLKSRKIRWVLKEGVNLLIWNWRRIAAAWTVSGNQMLETEVWRGAEFSSRKRLQTEICIAGLGFLPRSSFPLLFFMAREHLAALQLTLLCAF